jgi:hypothetical protein
MLISTSKGKKKTREEEVGSHEATNKVVTSFSTGIGKRSNFISSCQLAQPGCSLSEVNCLIWSEKR